MWNSYSEVQHLHLDVNYTYSPTIHLENLPLKRLKNPKILTTNEIIILDHFLILTNVYVAFTVCHRIS